MSSVYEYSNYRAVLADFFGSGRGKRALFAKAVGCDSSYLTRVMAGTADLSLEQGQRASELLGHGEGELDHFLLLIQVARASTPALKGHFKRRLESSRQERTKIERRLKDLKTLLERDQAKYYSAWYYAALHVAASVPSLQSIEAMASFFQLPLKVVSEAVAFLESIGILIRKEDRVTATTSHVHLGNSSLHLIQHHANWRLKAIERAQQDSSANLHYSSVVSLSEQDVERVKEICLEAIEKIRKLVKPSPEETVACYNLDVFRLK